MYNAIVGTNKIKRTITRAESLAMEQAWADKVSGKDKTKDGNT